MQYTSKPGPNSSSRRPQKRRSTQERHPQERRSTSSRLSNSRARTERHDPPPVEAGEPSARAPRVVGNKRAKTTARQHNVRPRRVRKGQKGRLLPVILLVVAAIVSIGTLNKIRLAYADYRLLQVQVDDKEVQLAALRKQYEAGQRRLAVLTSKKGRDQLLIKHGYVPPGDRILLFPPDPEKPNAAAISGNDLSPRPPADENAHVPLWRRAGETFGGWWQGLNRAAGGATQPGPPPQPDAEHDQPAPDLASPGP